MEKETLEREYKMAKLMGCGAGFWALNCQSLLKHGISK